MPRSKQASMERAISQAVAAGDEASLSLLLAKRHTHPAGASQILLWSTLECWQQKPALMWKMWQGTLAQGQPMFLVIDPQSSLDKSWEKIVRQAIAKRHPTHAQSLAAVLLRHIQGWSCSSLVSLMSWTLHAHDQEATLEIWKMLPLGEQCFFLKKIAGDSNLADAWDIILPNAHPQLFAEELELLSNDLSQEPKRTLLHAMTTTAPTHHHPSVRAFDILMAHAPQPLQVQHHLLWDTLARRYPDLMPCWGVCASRRQLQQVLGCASDNDAQGQGDQGRRRM